MKKKICIVLAGGTIAMAKDPETGALAPGKTMEQLLEKVPELKHIADIETVFVTDIDSTNMHPEIWVKIAKTIQERLDDYDGFVVTHGTDTMAYTSSAVSFMLQNLSKPVIFTGSQLPLADKTRSEARSNLVYAVQYATMDIAEVAVFFGTKLHRGNRAHKSSQFDFDAFSSYNFLLLGKTGIRAMLYPERVRRNGQDFKFLPLDPEKQVALLTYFPGMSPSILEDLVSSGYEGIVIQGAGPGNLPTKPDFSEAIRTLAAQGIPVVLVSQCEKGSAEIEMYEVGKKMKDAGAISGKDMTTEAAFTKLAWVLSQDSVKNLENAEIIMSVRNLMEKDIAGELSE